MARTLTRSMPRSIEIGNPGSNPLLSTERDPMSSQGVPYYVTYAHMKRQIVPALRFNQSLYEEALEQTLRPGDRWLDAGCGWKVLPEWRIDSELSLVHRAGM